MADPKKDRVKASSFKDTMKKLSGQFGGGDSDGPVAEYEREIKKLQVQIESMEQELRGLRQARTQVEQSLKQNEKLTAALMEAKNHIEALKNEVEKLTAPPSSYAIYSGPNQDGTVNVFISGRKMKVNLHPDIATTDLKKGQQLVLNEALNVVEVAGYELQGEVVRVKHLLGDDRAIVTFRAEEDHVVELAEQLSRDHLAVGDSLLYDLRSGYALEKLPKVEAEEMVLEEIPDVSYEDIGGLNEQIQIVKDAVELPFLYPEVYAEHKLRPPKGVLLYGPPGCGKTLIAKAVAASITRKLLNRSGKEMRSFFLHIKGPEILNKYVGESERHIREIFKKARERAEEGHPVIIFFDEMDALFRTRGSGISSDMEATIVPQFLSEIDGLESLRNVIVIGASNRQDLLDPAVLRAGRLDIRIKIDRPDEKGAADIFRKYLTADLPYHPDEVARVGGDSVAIAKALTQEAVNEMYSLCPENEFLEVTYANGEKEMLYFKDFTSGAMIEGIVSRAKKHAVKRVLSSGIKGLKKEDLIQAIQEEFKENEDLPNTTNPDDWAKIAGRRGDKIVHVRTMVKTADDPKQVETVTTGHYL